MIIKRTKHSKKIARLDDSWLAQYFQECEASIFADLAAALINDTKIVELKQGNTGVIAFGQLVLWDGATAIDTYRTVIE